MYMEGCIASKCNVLNENDLLLAIRCWELDTFLTNIKFVCFPTTTVTYLYIIIKDS